MNKGQRNHLRRTHFLRRLHRMGKRPGDPGVKGYRTTSTPCSCFLCDPHKWGEGDRHSVRVRTPLEDD